MNFKEWTISSISINTAAIIELHRVPYQINMGCFNFNFANVANPSPEHHSPFSFCIHRSLFKQLERSWR